MEVARRLVEALRPTDTVCRLGGDEFAVLLEDAGEEGAARAATRILEMLAGPFDVPESGSEIAMTVSIGISTVSETGAAGNRDAESEAESLLQTADRAMYAVKSSGRAGYRQS